ncbi:MAG TPA: hypothetical protein VHV52_11575 [Gaiellaceae bacterium]|jgi:hypothetical protein|nr:hypothetical protein [Gaiellaceae bacterium]
MTASETVAKPDAGNEYEVNIEGVVHEWHEATITVAQIRSLASWESTQQVIEVDAKDNSERTLTDTETIELKPGKGFGKKVSFKRG